MPSGFLARIEHTMNDKTLTILVSFMLSLCAVPVRGEEVDFGEPNKVYMGNNRCQAA